MRILAVVIVLSVIIYISYKKIVDNISFDYKLWDLDLSTLSISDFLTTGTITTRVNLLLILTNKNNFSITVKNLSAQFYDASTNVLVAESSNTANNNSDIVLQKNTVNNIQEDFDIYINPGTLPFLMNIKKKVPVTINYTVSFTVFGFPITTKDTMKWPQ